MKASTFAEHVHQGVVEDDIGLNSPLDKFMVNLPPTDKISFLRTCIDGTHKSNIVWLDAGLLHGIKEGQCLIRKIVLSITSKKGTPCNNIVFGHCIEDLLCIMKASTFAEHVHQGSVEDDIRLNSPLNKFMVNLLATNKISFLRTCIHGTHKRDIVWLDASLLHGIKEGQCLIRKIVLNITSKKGTPCNNIVFGHCIEDPLCIMKASTFAEHVHQCCIKDDIVFHISSFKIFMNLPSTNKVCQSSTRLQCTRECECIWLHIL